MKSRIPWDPNAPTPFDAQRWPTTVEGRVVSGARIHGYDAVDDLARHVRASDVTFLSLTGELPDEPTSRAFELALIWLAPIGIAEAPAHAALLARVCNAASSQVLAVAALALSEQARSAVESFLARSDEEVGSPLFAEVLTEIGWRAEGIERARTPAEAALCVLRSCGLGRPDQLESAWVSARLPVVAAEAFAAPKGAFRDYPLNTPPFAYTEDE